MLDGCKAKPQVLYPGDLANRLPKLKVSSALSTSTSFARVPLPQQPPLLVRATSPPLPHIKNPGLNADESPMWKIHPELTHICNVRLADYISDLLD